LLARNLASELVVATERFARKGLSAFIDRWRSRDLLEGRPVDVIRPDGRRDAGTARGIDEVGALIVEFEGGRIEHCLAGEVSVRRRPDAGAWIDAR
jgi:BirA family biotin operon repressor/biotin-[acetyl-CoA-carboxylase] ligase